MERGVRLVFLKERHIDTDVFRQAAKRAVTPGAKTSDVATDRLMGSLTNGETMRLAGIGRSAFYRYCREIDEGIRIHMENERLE